jgi:8-oxo-dGTP diphosphatase
MAESIPQAVPPDLAGVAQDEPVLIESDAVETEALADADEFRMVPQPAEIAATDSADSSTAMADRPARRSLVRKVRDWLRRAA